MQEYLNQVRHLQLGFESFSLLHIPRSGNTHANSPLATLATFSARGLPWVILVEDLCKPTEMKRQMVHIHQIRVGPSWMDPIVLFLNEDILLEEKSESKKVQRKTQFWLFEDQKLYKRSFVGPYLLCIYLEASELLLEELHEGICRSHTEGRFLSHRVLTQGYWWLSIQKEAQEYVKKCDQCQKFAPNIHQPRGILNPLSIP